jgi:glycopeptide antibiotics resistance protein
MKWLFLLIIIIAVFMLGAAMVFIDSGILRDAVICGLGALLGFLIAFRMQSRYTLLRDD